VQTLKLRAIPLYIYALFKVETLNRCTLKIQRDVVLIFSVLSVAYRNILLGRKWIPHLTKTFSSLLICENQFLIYVYSFLFCVTRHRRNPAITLFLPKASTPSAWLKNGSRSRCPEPLAKTVSLESSFFHNGTLP